MLWVVEIIWKEEQDRATAEKRELFMTNHIHAEPLVVILYNEIIKLSLLLCRREYIAE